MILLPLSEDFVDSHSLSQVFAILFIVCGQSTDAISSSSTFSSIFHFVSRDVTDDERLLFVLRSVHAR